MGKQTVWQGIFPAIALPMKHDYSINEPELRGYVSWLAQIEGLGGIVCNGHASEVTTCSREERKRIVEIVVDEVGDRIPVVSGVNCEGTMLAIQTALDAKEAGASAILIQPSHMWLRSGVSDETAVTFVRDIAEAVGIDCAVQVYAANSKGTYSTEALIEMAKIDNVRCLKLGVRNEPVYEHMLHAIKAAVPDISLFTCYDEALVMSMRQSRCDGALVGIASCIPELVVETWQAVRSGNLEKIESCNERIYAVSSALYGTAHISSESHAKAKEILYQRGVFSDPIARRPVLPMTQEEKDALSAALKIAGVGPVQQ